MKEKKAVNRIIELVMALIALAFVLPVIIVLVNSFKGQFYISDSPFTLPNKDTFVGFLNYINGIRKIGFLKSFFYSLFITTASTAAILLFTSNNCIHYLVIKTGKSVY